MTGVESRRLYEVFSTVFPDAGTVVVCRRVDGGG